jgi:predicted nucleic acid-binding protein
MTYLLDTSALLAHYRGEAGAPRVQALFEDPTQTIIIASITITEFSRRMIELGAAEVDVEGALSDYERMMAAVVAVDRAIALHAFALGRKASKRLPLADALIAAAAANRDAVLVHRDPHFDALPAEDLRQEKL